MINLLFTLAFVLFTNAQTIQYLNHYFGQTFFMTTLAPSLYPNTTILTGGYLYGTSSNLNFYTIPDPVTYNMPDNLIQYNAVSINSVPLLTSLICSSKHEIYSATVFQGSSINGIQTNTGNANNQNDFIIEYFSNDHLIGSQVFGSSGDDYLVQLNYKDKFLYSCGYSNSPQIDKAQTIGGYDAFFQKSSIWNQTGITFTFGSPFDDFCREIEVSSNRSIFVTGETLNTGSLTGITAGATTVSLLGNGLTNSNKASKYTSGYLYVLPLNAFYMINLPSGSVQPLKMELSSDEQNLYITGVTTGTFPGYTRSFISGSDNDVFLLKFDIVNNQMNWVQQFGSGFTERNIQLLLVPLSQTPYSNRTNSSTHDVVFVGGETSGSFDGQLNLGQYDLFLSCYLDSVRIWTQYYGTFGNEKFINLLWSGMLIIGGYSDFFMLVDGEKSAFKPNYFIMRVSLDQNINRNLTQMNYTQNQVTALTQATTESLVPTTAAAAYFVTPSNQPAGTRTLQLSIESLNDPQYKKLNTTQLVEKKQLLTMQGLSLLPLLIGATIVIFIFGTTIFIYICLTKKKKNQNEKVIIIEPPLDDPLQNSTTNLTTLNTVSKPYKSQSSNHGSKLTPSFMRSAPSDLTVFNSSFSQSSITEPVSTYSNTTQYTFVKALAEPGYLRINPETDLMVIKELARGGYGKVHLCKSLAKELEQRSNDTYCIAKFLDGN